MQHNSFAAAFVSLRRTADVGLFLRSGRRRTFFFDGGDFTNSPRRTGDVPSAADFADAISDDPASAGLLSESEVESLLRGHAAMETVSKEQAQSDVSLLFRTLQSAYGAYEYFGQEKFDAAEDAVTQWLSSQDDEIKVCLLYTSPSPRD